MEKLNYYKIKNYQNFFGKGLEYIVNLKKIYIMLIQIYKLLIQFKIKLDKINRAIYYKEFNPVKFN